MPFDGMLFGLAWFLATRGRFRAQELVMAFGIGMGSFGGQLFSLLALERNVPGYIVFPMTTGGNLFSGGRRRYLHLSREGFKGPMGSRKGS